MVSQPPLFRARNAPHGGKSPLIILVSKKAVPHAVARNRIRRRIRAALVNIGTKPHRPMIIIAGARVLDAPFEELLEELQKTLKSHG